MAALVLLAACGGGDGGDGGESGRTTLRVGAASSLTDAFTEIAERYEEANEGIDVELSFASSALIAHQANDLAPFDVVATADLGTMADMVDAGTVKGPTVFARNRLALIVEPGNPKRITGLADLAKKDVVVVLCAPTAPCGRYAAAALEKAGVQVDAASREENVRAVVAKVALGEADAGIVYKTDVPPGADDVEAVAFAGADDDDLLAVYPIAATTTGSNKEAAAALIAFVLSDAGRSVLRSRGFVDP